MAGGGHDLDVFETDALVLLGQVSGRAADVVGLVGLARDAGDAKKGLELRDPLRACLVQVLIGRGHREETTSR